jgi:hypothetical protein
VEGDLEKTKKEKVASLTNVHELSPKQGGLTQEEMQEVLNKETGKEIIQMIEPPNDI